VCEKFWAKSNGTTLAQHTADVVRAVKVLHDRHRDSFPEAWWKALAYAAFLHDLGKIDPRNQARLKKLPADGLPAEIPHSLLSLLLFMPEVIAGSDPLLAHAVFSAVAFHHWRDSFPDFLLGYRGGEIRQKAREMMEERQKWEDLCRRAAEDLRETAERYGLDVGIIGLNEELASYLQHSDLGAAGLLVPPYTMTFLPTRMSRNFDIDRERFRVFLSGNLMRADHFASMVEEAGAGISVDDIEQGVPRGPGEIGEAISSLLGTGSFWQKDFFAQNPGLRGSSMILVAPTGFGKTEFAYMWGAGAKNIMILPLRSATNMIYDRTEKLFGSGYAALLHGDAALEMYTRAGGQGTGNKKGDCRKTMDIARHLARPYVVATADQVAPAALRYPGFERVFAVLMDGALVIDEVQAYDPRAAAIVTCLVQQCAALGGRVLLMTATLPPFIRRQIEKRVGLDSSSLVNLLDQPVFAGIGSSARHRLEFLPRNGDGPVLARVLEHVGAGRKVLVVMNTVPSACRIYDLIKGRLAEVGVDADTVLLHARFTQQRRKELERAVTGEYLPNRPVRTGRPCVVVATQVVEASLDIDADVLFTEPAPADSLIQRMGRVYRRYARSEGCSAPEWANVIFMFDAAIGSGMGKVYDRDLVALSLVTAAGLLDSGAASIEQARQWLASSRWQKCFRGKKERLSDVNAALCRALEAFTGKTYLITEKEKMLWVEQTYTLLEEGVSGLNLGNYLARYREALDILDAGYCSDKKIDAMRLFREVSDITGVPAALAEDFYHEVREWAARSTPELNYFELAAGILPKYLVPCPRYIEEEKTPFIKLDMGRLLPSGTAAFDERLAGRLERWLSDLVIIDLEYCPEKGLKYFDE